MQFLLNYNCTTLQKNNNAQKFNIIQSDHISKNQTSRWNENWLKICSIINERKRDGWGMCHTIYRYIK